MMFDTDVQTSSLIRFESFILPIIKIINPKHIVQVGVGDGKLTEKLLQYVETISGKLTCIDTYSWNDTVKKMIASSQHGEWVSDFGVNALQQINPADLYILDDDYNYYTVFHELTAAWQISKKGNKSFFAFVRGTGWPFAQRDAYHMPENIPREYLQPYSWTQGVFTDCSETALDGLTIDTMAFALSDEGENNGVLKAIWSFMQDKKELKRFNIPAFNGLSFLFEAQTPFTELLEQHLSSLRQNQAHFEALEEHHANFLVEVHREAMKFEMSELGRQNQKFDTEQFCKHFQEGAGEKQGLGLVSIIMPTRNRPIHLKRALQSALAQTYRDIEIIVVNDAGENVEKIINEFKDSRIKYIDSDENKGPSATRNLGIQNSKGKYIAYLDDDDCYHSRHIEVLVNALNESGFPIAYTDTFRIAQQVVNDEIKILRRRLLKSRSVSLDTVLIRNPFVPVCACHLKECFDKANMFDETLRRHEDWELWIRFAMHFPFLHIPLAYSDYAITIGGNQAMTSWNGTFLNTALMIHNKYKHLTDNSSYILAAQLEFRDILRYSALQQLEQMTDEELHSPQLLETMKSIVENSMKSSEEDIRGARALMGSQKGFF